MLSSDFDPLTINEIQIPMPDMLRSAEENPDDEKSAEWGDNVVPEVEVNLNDDDKIEEPELNDDDDDDYDNDPDDLEELNKNESLDYLDEDKDTDF